MSTDSIEDQLQLLAERLDEASRLNRENREMLLVLRRQVGRPRSMRSRRSHRPRNARYRSWYGFREEMQEFERDAQSVRPGMATKLEVAARCGFHFRTLNRTMADFGLRPDQWPPSTWPSVPPNGRQSLA